MKDERPSVPCYEVYDADMSTAKKPYTVYDLNEAVCTAVEEWAEEYLAGRIAKGRMTAEQVAKMRGKTVEEILG